MIDTRETLRILSPCGPAGAEAMRARVRAECPDALPFLKQLIELGMIEGWRNVAGVNIPRDLPGAICGPFLTGRETIKKEGRDRHEPAAA